MCETCANKAFFIEQISTHSDNMYRTMRHGKSWFCFFSCPSVDRTRYVHVVWCENGIHEHLADYPVWRIGGRRISGNTLYFHFPPQYTYQLELTKQFVVDCHFSLSLVNLDLHLRLSICSCGEHLHKNEHLQCAKILSLDCGLCLRYKLSNN